MKQDGTHQHGEEPDDTQRDQRNDHTAEESGKSSEESECATCGDTSRGRDAASVSQRMRELRVPFIEGLFHLLQHALLMFGKRHNLTFHCLFKAVSAVGTSHRFPSCNTTTGSEGRCVTA